MTTPDLSPARARYLAECARGDPGVVIKRNPGIKGYEVKPDVSRKVVVASKPKPVPAPAAIAVTPWEKTALAFLRAAFAYGTSDEELRGLAREMERLTK